MELARWLLSVLGCVLLVAASGGEDDEAWEVYCNLDCDGRNTCKEQDLCNGEETQTVMCTDEDRRPCPGAEAGGRCPPRPCLWGAWSDWANEGASGLCSRNRRFTPNRCGGHPCMGRVSETVFCDPGLGPVQDCVFTTWSDWQLCDSKTLQRTRMRGIERLQENGGQPCEGILETTEACGDRHAPVDCELTDWMEWSGCSRTCGEGQHLRIRAILSKAEHGGKPCRSEDGEPLALQMTAPCSGDTCSTDEHARVCTFGPWGDWTSCSEDDRGSQTSSWDANSRHASRTQRFRRRSPNLEPHQAAACHGNLEETTPCKEFTQRTKEIAPSDCRFNPWGSWMLCDKTCDGGQTFRRREIAVRADHGGQPCDDVTAETRPCNEIPCSVDPEGSNCQLAPWTLWSACSATCGQGSQTRSRRVIIEASEGGRGCNDALQEVQSCQAVRQCVKHDCVWGDWTEWTNCTATCNGGQRNRSRSVAVPPSAGGRPCNAFVSTSEVEACANFLCPEDECRDGRWSDWDDWEACSHSCGHGVRWRRRKIKEQATPCGKEVSGPAEEVQACNQDVCQGEHTCMVAQWSLWDKCSKSCGGVQSRSRMIDINGSGSLKWCNSTDAKEGLALLETRSCNGPAEMLVQAQAPGLHDIIEACGYGEPVDCLLGSWSSWSLCSATCEGGARMRNRTEEQVPKNGGRSCNGTLGELAVCNTGPCEEPRDCRWSSWSSWSECTECDGERTRSRKIEDIGNRRGRGCGNGIAKEVAQCNSCPGHERFWCIWSDWTTGKCSVSCGLGHRLRERVLLRTTRPPINSSVALDDTIDANTSCSGNEVIAVACPWLRPCVKGCEPQDCTFSPWSVWAEPKASCDGLCWRSRSIERQANACGKLCDGQLEISKSCNLTNCDSARSCKVSDWSAWTECLSGARQRWRWREVAVPPGPLGIPCAGNLNETSPCAKPEPNTKPADCEFGHWSDWGDCSRTCGTGQHDRQRKVSQPAKGGGKPCIGSLAMVDSCGALPCLAGAASTENDCAIAQWSDWSGCSGGTGLQAFRTRSFSPAQGGGLPCEATLKEAGRCPSPEPIDCGFSNWAPWGSCDATCGGGQRFRTRQVETEARLGGIPCQGFLDQTESCNLAPCDPERDCAVSPWSEWSACTMKCGTGVQRRQRKVARPAKPGGVGCGTGLEEVRGCFGRTCVADQDCVWDAWQDWSACEAAEFCGFGIRKRHRELGVLPHGRGSPCEPLSGDEVAPSSQCRESCNEQICRDGSWGDWGTWGECSVTCDGGGVRMRSRTELIKANYCGRPAEGASEQFESCSVASKCPSDVGKVDCLFEDWQPWSQCSNPCNGYKKRSRRFTEPANGGAPCRGPVAEHSQCNPAPGEKSPLHCESGAPVDCKQRDWQDWSECSATCGTGARMRRRVVVQTPAFGGRECENPSEEIRECGTGVSCTDRIQDCLWGDWDDWGHCDPVQGRRERSRPVKQKKLGMGFGCNGTAREVAGCPRICKDKLYLCAWVDWRPWSACSTSCGIEGRRTRRRVLNISEIRPPQRQDNRGEVAVRAKFQLIPDKLVGGEAFHMTWEMILAFAAGLLGAAAVLMLALGGGQTRPPRWPLRPASPRWPFPPVESLAAQSSSVRRSLIGDGQCSDEELPML